MADKEKARPAFAVWIADVTAAVEAPNELRERTDPEPEQSLRFAGIRKVAIFGAAGRTGRLIVDLLLANSLRVTAFVRELRSGYDLPDVVRIVEGSIERDEDVREAIEEQDAVICALGPSRRGPPDVLAVAAGTIFPAMRDLEVRRYVGVLGATVRCPGDSATLGAAVVYGIIRIMARRFVRAAGTHLRMAEQSGLDWTIVRPPRLTDGPPAGVAAGYGVRLAARSSISRADLAEFVVSQLDTDRWVGRAPMVVGRTRPR